MCAPRRTSAPGTTRAPSSRNVRLAGVCETQRHLVERAASRRRRRRDSRSHGSTAARPSSAIGACASRRRRRARRRARPDSSASRMRSIAGAARSRLRLSERLVRRSQASRRSGMFSASSHVGSRRAGIGADSSRPRRQHLAQSAFERQLRRSSPSLSSLITKKSSARSPNVAMRASCTRTPRSRSVCATCASRPGRSPQTSASCVAAPVS